MALSFIGKPISLISQSDVRYRGILAGIDPAASTIQLSNVFSMGTESRRPAEEYIPPVQEPYAFIIFRASEVKDLAVDEIAPAPIPRQRSVHDDPAVIGVSAPTPQAVPAQYNGYVQQQQQQQQQQHPPQQPQQQRPPQQAQGGGPPPRQQGQRPNPVHSAAESLETVQRAIGEMRISQHNGQHPHHGQHQGGGHGGHGRRNQQPREIKVPNSDFDFESSNAKFEKKRTEEGDAAPTGGAEEGAAPVASAKDKEKPAYDPSKSFFDSLTSGTPARNVTAGGEPVRGGGKRGGGPGRNRREEERERNVATFGEPGGVGLMGPGAYVGGWGGYGRRGGGRPRRGGPGRGNAPQPVGGRS